MPQKRILFVDDEPNILDALRRRLRLVGQEWEADFVPGGLEACQRLQEAQFDVLVTDMRMPGMDGAQLLEEVLRRRPSIARIVLSGQCDLDVVFKTAGLAHQFLTKPCDYPLLRNTIVRACCARDRLGSEELQTRVIGVRCLPSDPEIYRRLGSEVDKPNGDMDTIGRLIGSDAAMTAKMLQLVRSGFFGTPHLLADPREAARILGKEILYSLVHQSEAFRPAQAPEGKSERVGRVLSGLNAHARAVASAIRAIMQAEGADPQLADQAALAGMLHDVGALLEVESFPEIGSSTFSRSFSEEPLPQRKTSQEGVGKESEREQTQNDGILRTREIWDTAGGALLELWGMPSDVVEAVLFQSCPRRKVSSGLSPLLVLHVAAAVLEEKPPFPEGDFSSTRDGFSSLIHEPIRLDEEYLRDVGLADRLSRWRELCLRAAEETLSSEQLPVSWPSCVWSTPREGSPSPTHPLQAVS